MPPTVKEILSVLHEVKDPEIPVLSVVELGVIRGVEILEDEIVIRMTPTFLACPAFEVMQREVMERVRELASGRRVRVHRQMSPPWSSKWLSPGAREKLKAYGVAPPPDHRGDPARVLQDELPCPYCGSSETALKNAFGPTLCRAILFCEACRQPFELFKPL